jgi:hypothetical protein
MHGYNWARDMAASYPLVLLRIPKFEKVINRMFPYNFAMEIETHQNLTETDFLLELNKLGGYPSFVQLDFDYMEQRFSFRGTPIINLINLYLVCEILTKHYQLNMQSGIHYHIAYDDRPLKGVGILNKNQKLIDKVLKRLDSWGYEGKYNERGVNLLFKGKWLCRRSSFKTFEFRIGEMTFDYQLIFKRIKECQQITHEFVRP